MTEAERYFLVVSEELNISKAAQLLFVSHQNISQHIQNLEEKYGTKLIIRKPKMALTAAGRDLAATLGHVKILEDQMQLRINERSKDFCGEISIGMPYSRSIIIAPKVIEYYRHRYTNVKVTFLEANSNELSKKLLDGTLDLFVGVQHKLIPQLGYDLLLDEKLYVVVPDNLLKQAFPNTYPTCIEKMSRGVDIADLADLPFAVSLPNAFLRRQIDNFLIKEHVQLNTVFESGNHKVQMHLCRKGLMASFCTQMHLHTIREFNQNLEGSERLYVFSVNRLSVTNCLYVVYHKDAYFPPYKMHMREVIRSVFREFELLDMESLDELQTSS